MHKDKFEMPDSLKGHFLVPSGTKIERLSDLLDLEFVGSREVLELYRNYIRFAEIGMGDFTRFKIDRKDCGCFTISENGGEPDFVPCKKHEKEVDEIEREE